MASTHQDSLQAKRIAGIISVVIFILVGINGIFTYSGAHLFIKEMLFAILFAIAVQFSIAISLIALPYVKGVGKLVLLVVYVAALTLSTLSAYTFIYNAGLPGTIGDSNAVNTQLKARVANQLSEVILLEQGFIDAQTERLAFLKRQAEEEALRGFRSGLGAGKGPEYYQKIEMLQADEVRFEAQKRKYAEAKTIYAEMDSALMQNTQGQREILILLLSRLKSVVITDESKQILSDISQSKLAIIQSPIETAMGVIMDRDAYSIQLAVSIIWAAVFDLLALFLGIIRYYILRPNYSILSVIYDTISAFVTFIIRLGYLKKDARQKYNQELQNQSHGTPLNSSEMQSFATYVMAGSLFSAGEDQNAIEPLQNLISHIEPLKLASDPRGVGIPFAVVDEQKAMKTLMAMLIQSQVFLSDVENGVYVMNPGSEMAQKILVFIKMGLKDPSKQKELSRFAIPAEANA
ncbi:MAG: hypothetical protein H8E21_16330 [Gammaproteobacteria bacterium]|nr:hypothetical protein [Gammaproteobacteria bacterium]MBL7001034.1 hypothetical protein [Gammaproteobacteria bacterium]